MKFSLKLNLLEFSFSCIIVLLWIKLVFSYLSVKLTYFQKELTSNVEAFNPLGLHEDFSNNIEIVLLPLMLIIIIRYFKYYGKFKEIILVSFCMFMLNIITAIINNKSLLESLNYSMKLFLPIYLFFFLVLYNNRTGKSLKPLLNKTIKLCLVLSILAILFFNPSFNRLRNYLPIFFSGIHTHNYILVSVFIGISYQIYRNGKYKMMTAFLLGSILFLFFGYNVRTPLIMYLIYATTMIFLVSDIFKVLFLKILVLAPLFLFLFFLIIDLNELSSGRLDMYVKKIDQLANYNFIEWVFGKGAGADLIITDVWWWEKKGAHSDVITYLVENGLLYLLLFVYTFIKITISSQKINAIYLVILSGCFFTSTISNGIFSRPIAGYLLFMVLAYIYVDINNRTQKTI